MAAEHFGHRPRVTGDRYISVVCASDARLRSVGSARDKINQCTEIMGAVVEGGEGCVSLPDSGVEPVSYTHLTLPTICSV